jgi:hypothetical protein
MPDEVKSMPPLVDTSTVAVVKSDIFVPDAIPGVIHLSAWSETRTAVTVSLIPSAVKRQDRSKFCFNGRVCDVGVSVTMTSVPPAIGPRAGERDMILE